MHKTWSSCRVVVAPRPYLVVISECSVDSGDGDVGGSLSVSMLITLNVVFRVDVVELFVLISTVAVLSVALLSLAIFVWVAPTSAVFPRSSEPRHDKTSKMNVHPAQTQISLGIRPV